jgi:hypothetical protein
VGSQPTISFAQAGIQVSFVIPAQAGIYLPIFRSDAMSHISNARPIPIYRDSLNVAQASRL